MLWLVALELVLELTQVWCSCIYSGLVLELVQKLVLCLAMGWLVLDLVAHETMVLDLTLEQVARDQDVVLVLTLV